MLKVETHHDPQPPPGKAVIAVARGAVIAAIAIDHHPSAVGIDERLAVAFDAQHIVHAIGACVGDAGHRQA
ncbi:hypothetical protein A8G00_13140 [Sphingobium sp. SA916]|nr:hypothetical protein A8G00_13140 [Sphingobium sp. SA916]